MRHAMHTQYASQDKQLRSLTQKASSVGDIKNEFCGVVFLNVAVTGRNKKICRRWGLAEMIERLALSLII